jgi:hypothetical protein
MSNIEKAFLDPKIVELMKNLVKEYLSQKSEATISEELKKESDSQNRK